MLTWLPWIYIGALVALLIVLTMRVRRLARPQQASSAAQAYGPWCAACGYDVRVMSALRCPECGQDFTKVKSLRFDPRSRERAPLWMIAVALLLIVPLWEAGVWLAIPEAARYWLSESWEQPDSDAYGAVYVTSIRFRTLYRWQDIEKYRRPEGLQMQLADAPERVPNLRVSDDGEWEASDIRVQMRGSTFGPQSILAWFDQGGIDMDDERVEAEAAYLHDRAKRRLAGASLDSLPDAPFQHSRVHDSFGWGNRDGLVLTGFGRICTAPFYLYLAAVLAEIVSLRRTPPVRLDPSIEFDTTRCRVICPLPER